MTPRETALANGDKFYEGKPCKKCKSTTKYVSTMSCEACTRSQGHKRYYEDIEATRAKQRQYSATRRREKPLLALNAELKYKFGITLDDYNAMLEKQNGGCAICSGTNKTKKLAVDHDHTTGKVRALLCDKCNRGIGLFDENQDRLYKVIEYLREHNATNNHNPNV